MFSAKEHAASEQQKSIDLLEGEVKKSSGDIPGQHEGASTSLGSRDISTHSNSSSRYGDTETPMNTDDTGKTSSKQMCTPSMKISKSTAESGNTCCHVKPDVIVQLVESVNTIQTSVAVLSRDMKGM